jgi:hypothetical protein
LLFFFFSIFCYALLACFFIASYLYVAFIASGGFAFFCYASPSACEAKKEGGFAYFGVA